MSKALLFIYGSLKRGFVHHRLLDGAEYRGSLSTARGFSLHRVGCYPALVAHGDGAVAGELYAVDDEHLSRLDDFEDCPVLYQRTTVTLEDGSRAMAYTMRAEQVRDSQALPEGCWKE